MFSFRINCYILLALMIVAGAFTQSKNPDISVITDFRAFTHNSTDAPAEKNRLNLDLHEVEMAIQGYLNPYARADVIFAKSGVDAPVEIEEAAASFVRGLPLGLNVKVGKYLVDFGNLNTSHPHAYPFIDRTLLHTFYFGEDGWKDTGVQASVLLPTGSVYTQLSINVLKGTFEESNATEVAEKQDLAFSGRLSSHLSVSDYSNLELGLSAARATYDNHEHLAFRRFGLDGKYKWRPNQYYSLMLQTEVLFENRDVMQHAEIAVETIHAAVSTAGFYSFINYQFHKRWNVGAIGEWLQAPGNREQTMQSIGFFIGLSPMEETSIIRLLFRQQKLPQSVNLAMVQVLFSLGPHKAHLF